MAAVLPDTEIRRIAVIVSGARRYRGYDRDELLADAMLGIAVALRRFDGRGELTAFAFMYARYAVLEGIRSRLPLAQRAYARGDVVPVQVALPESLPDPHGQDGFAQAEARVCLIPLLRLLSAKQRYVVEQYYWGHRTLAEIGVATHTSESNVCYLLSAATRRMGSPVLA